MVFAREFQGQILTFGVSGKLIMNAVVMHDLETDSLWSQFLASSVEGSFAGTQMELFPSQLTKWDAWIAQHPDTKLVDRTIGGGGFRDGYTSYYASGTAGVLGEENPDRRLPRKELIVGVDHGVDRVAYAFRDLSLTPVVNDTYDAEPVVVTFDADAEAAAAFERTVDSTTMRDDATGMLWSSLRGEALSGELAGTQLTQLPSFVSFWFAWTDFYPETALFGAGPPEST
jgi:hypothetical protein